MKKLLLASIAFSLAATAAMAADAPVRHKRYVKAPIYKAPPPMAYIPPVYEWSGFYVGGHVGWGHMREQATTQAAGALLALGATKKTVARTIEDGPLATAHLEHHLPIGFHGTFRRRIAD